MLANFTVSPVYATDSPGLSGPTISSGATPRTASPLWIAANSGPGCNPSSRALALSNLPLIGGPL